MSEIYKYYGDWKHLIKEGDVLLFKGAGIYSRFIKVSGDSQYTHVGVAS